MTSLDDDVPVGVAEGDTGIPVADRAALGMSAKWQR